jgi:hypothetical protein
MPATGTQLGGISYTWSHVLCGALTGLVFEECRLKPSNPSHSLAASCPSRRRRFWRTAARCHFRTLALQTKIEETSLRYLLWSLRRSLGFAEPPKER